MKTKCTKCTVKPIGEEFSGCLLDLPGCRHAVVFGFSFHCRHPEHRRMAMDSLSLHHGEELRRRYCDLRERRRQIFQSQLGMPLEECVDEILVRLLGEGQAGIPGGQVQHGGNEVNSLFAR